MRSGAGGQQVGSIRQIVETAEEIQFGEASRTLDYDCFPPNLLHEKRTNQGRDVGRVGPSMMIYSGGERTCSAKAHNGIATGRDEGLISTGNSW
jgi:hypothetical protein